MFVNYINKKDFPSLLVPTQKVGHLLFRLNLPGILFTLDDCFTSKVMLFPGRHLNMSVVLFCFGWHNTWKALLAFSWGRVCKCLGMFNFL